MENRHQHQIDSGKFYCLQLIAICRFCYFISGSSWFICLRIGISGLLGSQWNTATSNMSAFQQIFLIQAWKTSITSKLPDRFLQIKFDYLHKFYHGLIHFQWSGYPVDDANRLVHRCSARCIEWDRSGYYLWLYKTHVDMAIPIVQVSGPCKSVRTGRYPLGTGTFTLLSFAWDCPTSHTHTHKTAKTSLSY